MCTNRAVTFFFAVTAGTLGACGARGGGVVPDSGAPLRPCPGVCAPDPGSRPVDCAAQQANLEFFTIWDFEIGYGDSMYAYTDRSTSNIAPRGFGTATVADMTERCGPTQAMHVHGGPFRGWGGGVGIGFNNLWGRRCPDPGCPPITPASPHADATLDLSRWEGVSFWGRRGPQSQASVRVGLGDKYTDDDISYLMYRDERDQPRYCERNRECGCTNQARDCNYYGGPDGGSGSPGDAGTPAPAGYYCWDPAIDPQPSMARSEFNDPFSYATCNTTKCNEAYAAYPTAPVSGPLDPQFNGKACTHYSFASGMGAEYCFDPASDPPPYDSNLTCGDNWVFAVPLTTDWRLYLIPFTQLAQQGFGKKSPRLDLTAASALRMMWDVGWVDYWVDDVGFYRVRR
jgi:hypothetical protein